MDLLELISSYGHTLEQRGMEWWGSCPFHEDGDPSFSVSPTEDGYVWWCFSCKSGGGPVQFIQNHDHVSPEEARFIWNKMNGGEEVIDLEKDALTVHVDEWVEAIQNDDKAKAFFENRNISMDTVRHYHVGLDSGTLTYPFLDYAGAIKVHTRSLDGKEYRSVEGHLLWGLSQIPYGTTQIVVVEGYQDVLSCYEAGIPAVAMCGSSMYPEYWK